MVCTLMLQDLDAVDDALPIWKLRSLQAVEESTYTARKRRRVHLGSNCWQLSWTEEKLTVISRI